MRLASEEIVSSRVRRSYELTDDGAAALRAEATRMAEAASLVTRGEAAVRADGASWKAQTT